MSVTEIAVLQNPRKSPGRPPERLNVVVFFKLAFGTEPIVESLSWPKNWPLPQAGDSIRVGKNSGFVTHLTFAPEANTIYINTR